MIGPVSRPVAGLIGVPGKVSVNVRVVRKQPVCDPIEVQAGVFRSCTVEPLETRIEGAVLEVQQDGKVELLSELIDHFHRQKV